LEFLAWAFLCVKKLNMALVSYRLHFTCLYSRWANLRLWWKVSYIGYWGERPANNGPRERRETFESSAEKRGLFSFSTGEGGGKIWEAQKTGSSTSKAGADGLMDPLLTQELEIRALDGSERTLRAMLGRERAERIEAQEKAEQLERKLQRLEADLDRERRRSAGLRAKLLQEPQVSEEHNC
jgi:hypothetical protein